MELFYKGEKVTFEQTDIIGGIKVTHDGKTKMIARQGRHGGDNFTDVTGAVNEVKASIDAGSFSLDQLPTYSPCIRTI